MLKRIITISFLFVLVNIFGQEKTTPVEFVNPFLGTSNHGNTFPGAVVPWGMISLSPHNSPGSPSGYISGDKYFYGIGSAHLSGTGCADLGGIVFIVSNGELRVDPEKFRTEYEDEKAEPGYYSVYLSELKMKVETTVSERSGLIKITSDKDVEINLLVDVGRSLAIIGGGMIRFSENDIFEGYNISGGFCGEENRQKLFFAAQINSEASCKGVWKNNTVTFESTASAKDIPVGGWMKLHILKDQPSLVKVGISYTSIENARKNLETEISDWDFNRVRNEASVKWQKQLERIKVEGKSHENKIIFYTALYHTIIHPNIINDINGDYPLMGSKGVGNYKNRNRYTVFSLWDTYRTLHPFMTLAFPERQSEFIKTMIDMYYESGYLPKWELAGAETYMMVGDGAVPVISDSFIKGITDFNAEDALEAMLKPVSLTAGQSAPPERAGYHQLLEFKYIPYEQSITDDWWVWGSVSTSLEYNYCDWTIGQMAKKMGRSGIAKDFYERSSYYKNLFDKSTLFMRPRLKSGCWIDPFDSLATEGSGDWSGSGGPGYVEGNAWNYTWFVPHDIIGLINLFGGTVKFSNKLLKCFSNGQFTINNEPDISYPYLFTYIKGKEKLASQLVLQIIENDFGTGCNGLPGNDDCGTISAGLAFSMMGFYPACPASDEYCLCEPIFDKVIIELDNKYYPGDEIVIIKSGNLSRMIKFNGQIIGGFKISHSQMIKGGILEF